MRVLLAEDDLLLGDGLSTGLRQLGFQVDWVRDGPSASIELRSGVYAAAVLDLGLPLQDGLDVLGEIRNKGITTPVIVLTARDAVFDRIRGLDRGADDYVIKPIDLDELAARLRALVRRAHGKPSERITVPGIELDPAQRSVEVDGQQVPLSPREFDLLQLLMLNAGRVLSRDWIEQHLYSWSGEVDSNAVEVHIHYLRRKIGAKRIATIRGVGYTMSRERGGEA
jgi:DNA-binding response OmpR family regulator